MYSYYIDNNINDNVDVFISSARVGLIADEQLLITGRVVSDFPIKQFNCEWLYESPLSSRNQLDYAPKLRAKLGLAESKNVARFSLSIDLDQRVSEHHFVVLGEDDSGQQVRLFSGFIEAAEKVERVVMVVGSPRSGTSALGRGLRRALNTKAHGESHVLHGLAEMIDNSRLYFHDSPTAQVKGNLVNETLPSVLLAQQLKVLRKLYKLNYGDQVHLDKTPGIPMLKALPVAFLAWPNTKVIFCKRRAIENVASRLNKFPKVGLLNHAKQWKQSFVSWRKAKNEINALTKNTDWNIEVDQFLMATQADSIAQKVQAFLGLNEQELDSLLKVLAGDKPEQTTDNAYSLKGLDDMPWAEADKHDFITICQEEMSKQGYSFTSSYFEEQQ